MKVAHDKFEKCGFKGGLARLPPLQVGISPSEARTHDLSIASPVAPPLDQEPTKYYKLTELIYY